MNGEKKALSVKRQNQWKVAEERSIKEDTELYERQKREGNVPGNKKYIPRIKGKSGYSEDAKYPIGWRPHTNKEKE